MRMYNKYISALSFAAILFSSCDKSDNKGDSGDPTLSSKYIVAVSPVASTGVADYLLTADNLDAGTISTERNGVEQDGSYRCYVTHKGLFFSMLYGQGNPGAVTAYGIPRSGSASPQRAGCDEPAGWCVDGDRDRRRRDGGLRPPAAAPMTDRRLRAAGGADVRWMKSRAPG